MRANAADRLLAWYDANARALPWRAPPGAPPPEPYRVWLSEVMLQQTGVATVEPRYRRFLARWPSVEALAAADDAEVMHEWAGLGYYARARNLLACARAVVRDHGGSFPDSEAGLLALPGVGDYTAAALAAIAFGRPAAVVDGNVERVVARLEALEIPLALARPRIRAVVAALTPAHRPGDFAQAMMDLGATICRPRAPLCPACPLRGGCKACAAGDPKAFPVKTARKPRPVRTGQAFILEHREALLLERRPAKGLLGGMPGFPATPPAPARWREIGEVRHVFTHFELRLAVLHGQTARRPPGLWHERATIEAAGLPTLFRKAARLLAPLAGLDAAA